MDNKRQKDMSLGAMITASDKKGTQSGKKVYVLNGNTYLPINNTSESSLSYGQLLTFNSALNSNNDGPGWQVNACVAARHKNFSISTNNDSYWYGTRIFAYLFNNKRPTDAGWTGGIFMNVYGIEFGHSSFSGYWESFAKIIGSNTTKPDHNHTYTAETRAATTRDDRVIKWKENNKGKEVPDSISKITEEDRRKAKYQESLNRTANFIRYGGTTFMIYTDAWLQRFIHKTISHDGVYRYNSIGVLSIAQQVDAVKAQNLIDKMNAGVAHLKSLKIPKGSLF